MEFSKPTFLEPMLQNNRLDRVAASNEDTFCESGANEALHAEPHFANHVVN